MVFVNFFWSSFGTRDQGIEKGEGGGDVEKGGGGGGGGRWYRVEVPKRKAVLLCGSVLVLAARADVSCVDIWITHWRGMGTSFSVCLADYCCLVTDHT